jgi:hypothetical protein
MCHFIIKVIYDEYEKWKMQKKKQPKNFPSSLPRHKHHEQFSVFFVSFSFFNLCVYGLKGDGYIVIFSFDLRMACLHNFLSLLSLRIIIQEAFFHIIIYFLWVIILMAAK